MFPNDFRINTSISTKASNFNSYHIEARDNIYTDCHILQYLAELTFINI